MVFTMVDEGRSIWRSRSQPAVNYLGSGLVKTDGEMNLLASTPAMLPAFLCGALALKYREDFVYMNRNKANQKHFKRDRITQLMGTILYGALTAAYLLALSGRFAAVNVGTITPFAIGGTLILAASHIRTGYSARAKKAAAQTFVALLAIGSLALFINQKKLNT